MFQPAATLWGHSAGVLTLEVADGRLYSGSMDNTIKVLCMNYVLMCSYSFLGQDTVQHVMKGCSESFNFPFYHECVSFRIMRDFHA